MSFRIFFFSRQDLCTEDKDGGEKMSRIQILRATYSVESEYTRCILFSVHILQAITEQVKCNGEKRWKKKEKIRGEKEKSWSGFWIEETEKEEYELLKQDCIKKEKSSFHSSLSFLYLIASNRKELYSGERH